MRTHTTTPTTPTESASVPESKFRVQVASEHPHVTLAQIAADGEPGDVFGLTKLGGKQGFALKRVLHEDGTFGTVSGLPAVAEWAPAQLERLVLVGKRVERSAKQNAQAPKARAKSRARKASKRSAKPSERSEAQHKATLRMLKSNPTATATYKAKYGL